MTHCCQSHVEKWKSSPGQHDSSQSRCRVGDPTRQLSAPQCCLCSRRSPPQPMGCLPHPPPPSLKEENCSEEYRGQPRSHWEPLGAKPASARQCQSRLAGCISRTKQVLTQPATRNSSSPRPAANPQQPSCILPETPTDFFHQETAAVGRRRISRHRRTALTLGEPIAHQSRAR